MNPLSLRIPSVLFALSVFGVTACAVNAEPLPSDGDLAEQTASEATGTTSSNLTSDGTIRGFGGKCLTTLGYTSANGTAVVLWDCLGQENQKWRMGANGTIVGFGGKCLTTINYSSANGTRLGLWDCLGQKNQAWRVLSNSHIDGLDAKCVATYGYTSANGTPVVMWDCLNQANLEWQTPGAAPPPPPPPPPACVSRLKAYNTDCYTAGGSPSGTPVGTWSTTTCEKTAVDYVTAQNHARQQWVNTFQVPLCGALVPCCNVGTVTVP